MPVSSGDFCCDFSSFNTRHLSKRQSIPLICGALLWELYSLVSTSVDHMLQVAKKKPDYCIYQGRGIHRQGVIETDVLLRVDSCKAKKRLNFDCFKKLYLMLI